METNLGGIITDDVRLGNQFSVARTLLHELVVRLFDSESLPIAG